MLRPTPEEAAFSSSMAASTSGTSAKIAAMAPLGSLAVSDPLAAANRNPSSRLNTPAARAAAISPRLCPNTTAGRTPRLDHSAVRAHSSA